MTDDVKMTEACLWQSDDSVSSGVPSRIRELQELREDLNLVSVEDGLMQLSLSQMDPDLHTLARVTDFERRCLHYRLCVDPIVCTCLYIPPWSQVRACPSFKEMFSFLVLRHVMPPREMIELLFSAYSEMPILNKFCLEDVKQLACGSFYVELNTTSAFSKWIFFGATFPFKYNSGGVCNKEDVEIVACLELLAVFLLLDGILPEGIPLNFGKAVEIAQRMTYADRMTLQLACGSKTPETVQLACGSEMVETAIACKKERVRAFLNWLLFNFEQSGKSEDEVAAALYEWSQSKEFTDITGIESKPSSENIMMELVRLVRHSRLMAACQGRTALDVFVDSTAYGSLSDLKEEFVAGDCCVCGTDVYFDDESTLGDRVKCDECGGARHYYGCVAGTFWGSNPKCTRADCQV